MKSLSSIPSAPNSLPILGHLVPLLRDPLAFLRSLPACGKLVRVRMGPLAMVVICDPELTQQALVDDRSFDKGGPLYDRIREVLGESLGTCPHSAHRRLRRLAQPAFHPARLPGYAQTMSTCLDEATRSWQPGQVLDVPTEMIKITSEVTAATLFSDALPPAELDQIFQDVQTVVDGWYHRMFLIPPLDRLPSPGNRSYQRARTHLHDTCNRIIVKRQADRTDHGDLLSALIAARDPETSGRGMTDAEIGDAIVNFYIGGAETTASVLAWALHLLAQNPEIEKRLHTEVDTVLGTAPATHADLPRLELAGRIITETLRLRAPGWFLTRKVTTDTHLGGHLLPAGTSIAYSPYLIHHRPDLYDQAEAFDPDRWHPQRPQPPRHAFLPFAAGSRKCIGDTFAMTQATIALATITARWHLEHMPGHQEVRPALGTVMRPRELHMTASPRTTT